MFSRRHKSPLKMKNIKSLILLMVALATVFGCNLLGETKTIEIKRGRLKFVQTLRYGSVGTHGSKGWSVINKEFFLDKKKISPPEELDGCSASPNENVEAFNCFKFKDLREMAYVVRIKDNKPDWIKIYDEDSTRSSGKNLGEWADEIDGKWLIFKDFLFNVLSDEKREIKGLPDYPENYFRAISPDLQTIVYEGSCFYGFPDAPESLKKLREKKCQETEKLYPNNLINLWLTEVKTGEAKFIEVSREKYDWLIWDQAKYPARKDWLKFFQQKLTWEKDQNGKFQLIFPK